MADWDLLLTDASIATMRGDEREYGIAEVSAIAVKDGHIDWIGRTNELPRGNAAREYSVAGRWLTPALIDCHTHVVFAGNRAAEFERRRQGATYEEIAQAGGGIVSTVTATRQASADELQAASAPRLAALRREGVATVEIKSGYGLDLETELKMLRVARALGDVLGMTVKTSFLGAHTLPPEYQGRADEYVAFLTDTVLPAAHAEGLVDAVDAYCERIAFSDAKIARVFEAARTLGLPVKLHADQLSDSGGARLASEFRALSADHLEYASESGLEALAQAGCVAVLLPGAFLTLGETQLPPVQRLRELRVPIAIASDCNPGTSPLCSLQSAMVLAASLFKLTPEECLAGVTREAARALGLRDRGTLEAGKRADIAVWDVGHPRELSYWLGLNPLHELLIAGDSRS